jgi:hypothetical protein
LVLKSENGSAFGAQEVQKLTGHDGAADTTYYSLGSESAPQQCGTAGALSFHIG